MDGGSVACPRRNFASGRDSTRGLERPDLRRGGMALSATIPTRVGLGVRHTLGLARRGLLGADTAGKAKCGRLVPDLAPEAAQNREKGPTGSAARLLACALARDCRVLRG